MRASDFHFDLPPELIAQYPSKSRRESRLLVVEGAGAFLWLEPDGTPRYC